MPRFEDDFNAYPDGPLAGNGPWTDVSTATGFNTVSSGDVLMGNAGADGNMTVASDIGDGNHQVTMEALDMGSQNGFPLCLRALSDQTFVGARLSGLEMQIYDRIDGDFGEPIRLTPPLSPNNREWTLRVHGTDIQMSSGSMHLGSGQTTVSAATQFAGILSRSGTGSACTRWIQEEQTEPLTVPPVPTLDLRTSTGAYREKVLGSMLGNSLSAWAIYMQFSPNGETASPSFMGNWQGQNPNTILLRYPNQSEIDFIYVGSNGQRFDLTLTESLDQRYWHGVAFRYNGSTIKIFLYRQKDGQAFESSELAVTSWTGSSDRMFFGRSSVAQLGADGAFGELAVYENTIPTDQQLADLCARQALASDFNPVSFYAFDTVAGQGDAVDSVGTADFEYVASGEFSTVSIRTYPTPSAPPEPTANPYQMMI